MVMPRLPPVGGENQAIEESATKGDLAHVEQSAYE
jgi:hypothetical protein